MAASATIVSPLSPLHKFLSTSKPIRPFLVNHNSTYPPHISYLTLSKKQHYPINNYGLVLKTPRNLRPSATSSEDVADTAQEIVSSAASDNTGNIVIQVLFFVAFIGLSVVTVGVIYIAVTDFLTKREGEKFKREEEAKNKFKKKKKKKTGKKNLALRPKPRGFGEKRVLVEDYDDDDDDE